MFEICRDCALPWQDQVCANCGCPEPIVQSPPLDVVDERRPKIRTPKKPSTSVVRRSSTVVDVDGALTVKPIE